MRGGYVHNHILLDPIEKEALRFGAQVDREVAIRVDGRVLYGDLLILGGSKRILIEAELSPKRILNDVAKAAALGLCELWVVVPNPRVARSVRRRVLKQSVELGARLFVLLLPQALQRLEEILELNSGSNVDSGKKTTNQLDQ